MCHLRLLSGSGDSYVAACGLFSRDPATGAKRLGGFDPDHAKKMIGFAKAMLWASQSVSTPAGEPVQVRSYTLLGWSFSQHCRSAV